MIVSLYELKFPSNKDTLRKVLLELTLWFWRWFLNFVIVLMPFCHEIPLEKDKPFKYQSSKNALCQVWLKWALCFWRIKFLNFGNAFSLSFEQSWIHFTQGCFAQSLVEFDLFCRDDFKISLMYFCYFLIISARKRTGPLIWTNLNYFKLKICQVWLKMAEWFWRRRQKCEKFMTTKNTDDTCKFGKKS